MPIPPLLASPGFSLKAISSHPLPQPSGAHQQLPSLLTPVWAFLLQIYPLKLIKDPILLANTALFFPVSLFGDQAALIV